MRQEEIAKMEDAIKTDYPNIVGMVVLKDDRTVYEKYFNGCTEASRIHVFSVTKSILSILFGVALDKGYIESINQKVLEFYPKYTVKKGEKTLQKITLRNMLTMTANAEVISYNKKNLKRELCNEDRQQNRRQGKVKRWEELWL